MAALAPSTLYGNYILTLTHTKKEMLIYLWIEMIDGNQGYDQLNTGKVSVLSQICSHTEAEVINL